MTEFDSVLPRCGAFDVSGAGGAGVTALAGVGGAVAAAAGGGAAIRTVNANFPLVACPSDAAVRHTTVYRPPAIVPVIAARMPFSDSDLTGPSATDVPAESSNCKVVKRTSGCSENQRRSSAGAVVSVAFADGVLRTR